MTSEEGVIAATNAMEEVINWLVAEGIEDIDTARPVRDFGVKMFKIGQQLGLAGVSYETFNKDAKARKVVGLE